LCAFQSYNAYGKDSVKNSKNLHIQGSNNKKKLSNHLSVHGWLIVVKPPYMKDFQSDCTKSLNAKPHVDGVNVPIT